MISMKEEKLEDKSKMEFKVGDKAFYFDDLCTIVGLKEDEGMNEIEAEVVFEDLPEHRVKEFRSWINSYAVDYKFLKKAIEFEICVESKDKKDIHPMDVNWDSVLHTKSRGFPVFDGCPEVIISKPEPKKEVSHFDCQTISDTIGFWKG